MSEYVILVVERRGGVVHPEGRSPEGLYLLAYDPDAQGGRGFAEGTVSLDRAMKFPDAGAALACWRQQSKIRPLRSDGKPNRPLTAFTVEVLSVDQARKEA